MAKMKDNYLNLKVIVGGNALAPSPDCSIEGIKPTIKPIDRTIVEQERMKRDKRLGQDRFGSRKQCCICGDIPTKIATYPVQGATRIERYCDSCVEKTFARSATSN